METPTEDAWMETYRPIPNPRLAKPGNAIWATEYEFDPHDEVDWAFICSRPETQIWTVVEADYGGDEFIVEGLRWVNRRAHLVTVKHWKSGTFYEVPYFISDPDETEDGRVQP